MKNMNIDIKDAGSYFRGLLLLISKDKRITESEAVLVKRVGKALGFEKEFCDNAVHDILVNNYIAEVPPVFSSQEIAKKFIKDGLTIAASDNYLHPSEIEWLKATAKKNGIEQRWVIEEKEKIFKSNHTTQRLEAEELKVSHS